jgi:hypothetical protein
VRFVQKWRTFSTTLFMRRSRKRRRRRTLPLEMTKRTNSVGLLEN